MILRTHGQERRFQLQGKCGLLHAKGTAAASVLAELTGPRRAHRVCASEEEAAPHHPAEPSSPEPNTKQPSYHLCSEEGGGSPSVGGSKQQPSSSGLRSTGPARPRPAHPGKEKSQRVLSARACSHGLKNAVLVALESPGLVPPAPHIPLRDRRLSQRPKPPRPSPLQRLFRKAEPGSMAEQRGTDVPEPRARWSPTPATNLGVSVTTMLSARESKLTAPRHFPFRETGRKKRSKGSLRTASCDPRWLRGLPTRAATGATPARTKVNHHASIGLCSLPLGIPISEQVS